MSAKNRILIRGGTVVSGDDRVSELRRGDVLVEGTRIVAVAPTIDADDAEVVNAKGKIVMPGFADSHRHTWQSLLRAVGADRTLGQYYTGMRLVMGGLYTPDDMLLANYLGALECLNAGITTLFDWSHNNNTPDHADAAIAGLRDAGIRGVWAYGNGNDEWIPPNDKPSAGASAALLHQRPVAAYGVRIPWAGVHADRADGTGVSVREGAGDSSVRPRRRGALVGVRADRDDAAAWASLP